MARSARVHSSVFSPAASSRPKKYASTTSWNAALPLPSAIPISGPQSRNGMSTRSPFSGASARGGLRRSGIAVIPVRSGRGRLQIPPFRGICDQHRRVFPPVCTVRQEDPDEPRGCEPGRRSGARDRRPRAAGRRRGVRVAAAADRRYAPGAVMTTSSHGVEFIASFEGFVDHPYRDSGGVWTIGYGHTGAGTSSMGRITHAQGLELLARDVRSAERAVDALPQRLTQPQFDALVSIVFNCGPGILAPSRSLGRALREHGTRGVPAAMKLYTHDA